MQKYKLAEDQRRALVSRCSRGPASARCPATLISTAAAARTLRWCSQTAHAVVVHSRTSSRQSTAQLTTCSRCLAAEKPMAMVQRGSAAQTFNAGLLLRAGCYSASAPRTCSALTSAAWTSGAQRVGSRLLSLMITGRMRQTSTSTSPMRCARRATLDRNKCVPSKHDSYRCISRMAFLLMRATLPEYPGCHTSAMIKWHHNPHTSDIEDVGASAQGHYVVLASEGHCLCGIDVAAPRHLRRSPQQPVATYLQSFRKQFTEREVAARASLPAPAPCLAKHTVALCFLW